MEAGAYDFGGERRFEAILAALAESVTIRDPDDRIVYANAAALRQLRFASVEELREAHPAAIMAEYVVTGAHGELLTMDDVPSVRIFRGQQSEPLLMKTVHRVTGDEKWMLLKAAPLYDTEGNIDATVTVIEDVTLAKRAELRASAIAETLQHSLMPDELPAIDGWDAAALYRSAADGMDVGGDFYDVFRVQDSWVVLIGDVTGKGVQAAAMTALVRHSAHIVAEDTPQPAAILRRLNQVLCRQPNLSICTALCLRLHGAEVTLSVAGHPLPLVAGDATIRSVGEPGTLLGAGIEGRWDDHTITLGIGETLVLFTDGITDTVGDGERFGDDRLCDLLLQGAGLGPSEMLACLDEALTGFQVGPQADDTAALALRLRG